MDQRLDIPIDLAETWLDKILPQLRPLALRIHIVGSIRRERERVNDIDLVVETHQRDRFAARLRQRAVDILADGLEHTSVLLRNGLKIDAWYARLEDRTLFAATPTNLGSLLVARTGSKPFNIWFAQWALNRGHRWNPHQGLSIAGRLLDGPTEQQIAAALGKDPADSQRAQHLEAALFAAVRLPWIDPIDRDDERWLSYLD